MKIPYFHSEVSGFALFFVTSIVFSAVCWAQDREVLISSPAVMSSENVESYRDALPSSLYSWVLAGDVYFRFSSKLPYSFSNLLSKVPASDLEQARAVEGVSDTIDAFSIMSNSLVSQTAGKDSLYSGELIWFSKRDEMRRAKVFHVRTWGRNMNETLRFLSPRTLSGLSYNTSRSQGDDIDLYWSCSSLIDKPRRLPSAQRGVGMLGGNFSLDDIFVSSKKLQDGISRIIGEKKMLLSFSSKEPLFLMDSSPVSQSIVSQLGPAFSLSEHSVEPLLSRSSGSPTSTFWNALVRAWPTNTAWLPTNVVFYERDVWLIETVFKDAFYPSAREVLVIDKQSNLPFYKLSYEKNGLLRKIVIASWSLAHSGDKQKSIPFLATVLAVNPRDMSATAWATSEAHFGLSVGAKEQLEQVSLGCSPD